MFEVRFLENANEFLSSINVKARTKILYNINKATLLNDTKIFKKLVGTDIWEFRTLYNKIQYRLFAFWDKTDKTETLVFCTHGFIKKTQETPKKEIEKAEQIKKEYFEQS